MEREVQDGEGTTWRCVQAFAGLSDAAAAQEAARTDGGRVQVVATPSGGARSVRLQLPQRWKEQLSDDALVAAIRDGQRDAEAQDAAPAAP